MWTQGAPRAREHLGTRDDRHRQLRLGFKNSASPNDNQRSLIWETDSRLQSSFPVLPFKDKAVYFKFCNYTYCVFTLMHTFMWWSGQATGIGFLLPPRGSQGLNSGYEAQKQASFLVKPSGGPPSKATFIINKLHVRIVIKRSYPHHSPTGWLTDKRIKEG